MSMKLTCDEATTICDKNQYDEATLWEKIKLSIHLFLCNKCGLYTRQNTTMSKCYEGHVKLRRVNKPCLSENEKRHIEEEIKSRIEPSTSDIE